MNSENKRGWAARQQLPLDRNPDICPLCHHAVEPGETAIFHVLGADRKQGTRLEILYRCPRDSCQRFFIARYQFGGNDKYAFEEAVPSAWIAPTLAPEIIEISAAFAKIYRQASQAEGMQLDEIAGVGYRKALEFLIKDYCVQEHPEEADEIRKVLLGACISNWVDDPKIKDCAKRAAWLGNDETHYVRKWEDKDIKDLKILIEITMGWIRNSVLTKKYLADMPS